MKKIKNIVLLAAIFIIAASYAWANTSTINPNNPAANSPLSSAAVRNNFRAAYNDINDIWSAIASATGIPGGSTGQIQYNAGSGAFGGFTISGDCALVYSTGVITCTKTGGVSFAPSATTDTTNASNISSGTLASARLPAPFTSASASGNTTTFGTTWGALISGDCVNIDAFGNLKDSGGPCSSAGTVTSVGLSTDASWLTVGSSPVTSSGTITLNATTGLTANQFLATPDGVTGAVSLRAIVAADVPTLNQNTTGSAAKWTTARNLAGNSVDGSANVAFSNKFIVQGTADSGLSGAQFLGSLSTGIVKNTTTTGVLSIAGSSDVVGLFTGCSGTDYLGADGACHAASGSGTVTTTGTPASGNLTEFSGSTSITNGDLSGDVTTSGTLATTVGKVNGVSYGASPSSNTVPVVTGANTVTYEAVPNAALANSSLTVTAGTGMSGGGSVSLGGSVTLTNAGVTSISGDGTYITNSGSTGAVTLTNTFGSAAQKTAATTATAGDVVLRDSNANVFNNNSLQNATKTTSAGGTTTLTAASSRYQALTGSSSQTYKLPDATTLSLGPWFTFNNNSSGSLIITNNGGTTLYTVPAGGIIQTGPTDISTSNGSWDFHGYFPGTITWSSGVTGLVFNTALTTTPQINAGASSCTAPSFIPQRGASTTGFGGAGTNICGAVGGTTAFTATATTFNIPTGSNYQINGSQISCSNLSNGATGCSTATGTSGATIPLLNAANTWSGVQTFTNSDIAILGSSTGKTTITSDNAGATNFTMHLPAANDTLADLAGSQALTNKDLSGAGNTFPTFNQNTTGSAAKWTTARNLAGNSVDGSANVAFANKFIVQGTTDSGLSGAQFLGALSTGILKNTTTTGVLSNAAASDVVALFSTCSGSQYLGADGACHNASGAGTVTSITCNAGLTGGTITTSGTCAVDETYSNTFTAAQTDSQSIGATSTDGVVLTNPTSAAAASQQWSPRLRWTGNGWKTNATAASQEVDAIAELQPVQGTANPTFNWVLSGQINGGGYSALVTVPSTGGFNINSGTYQVGGTQISCSSLSNGATGCSTATGTSGATLPLLNAANTWSGAQTFNNSDIKLLGSSTGATTFTSANAGSSNFTLTVPAASDTIALLGTAQTFTALKTINVAPGLYLTGSSAETDCVNQNSGTSLALNLNNGNTQCVTITGAVTITISAPTHPVKSTIRITQDGTGHVYSLSGCKWAGGTAITYSTAASAVDIISILYDGTNYYCMGGAGFS